MKVDLHLHTVASDGCWSPEELLQSVIEAKVGLFAVTDHDELGALEEAAGLAADAGVGFVKGVELTSKCSGKVCHILGYRIDASNEGLASLCRENTERMRDLNLSQAKKLIADGMKFDFEEFRNYKFDRRRGGGVLINFLVDKEIFPTFGESLQFIARNIEWDSPDYRPPAEVVSVIKAAGGRAVLAHPGSSLLDEKFTEKELDAFIEMGIEGLECFTSYHSSELAEQFVKYCTQRNLLITAGSDCHGPFLKSRVLGKPETDISRLQLGDIWP